MTFAMTFSSANVGLCSACMAQQACNDQQPWQDTVNDTPKLAFGMSTAEVV